MVKPFSELPRSMNRLNRRVVRGASIVARQVAIAIGGTVVDTTRVDTGKARSNWRASLGAPLSGTIPPYSPGNKLGQSEVANAASAKIQQAQVIRRFRADQPTPSIFITNNVDYIETLNNGGPRVAPGLMVEQALQTGRDVLRSIKILDLV